METKSRRKSQCVTSAPGKFLSVPAAPDIWTLLVRTPQSFILPHVRRILAVAVATSTLGLVCLDASAMNDVVHARDPAIRAAKAGLLLVRLEGGASLSANSLTDGRVAGYRLSALFSQQVDVTEAGRRIVWLLATPDDDALKNGTNGWERAHRFIADSRESLLARGVQDVYAEPNIEHMPITPNAAAVTATQSRVGKPPVSPPWPLPPSFAWHLEAKYSQLKEARKIASNGACIPRLTILDTGIHAAHDTTPRGIQLMLAKNFVEGGTNVEDPGNTGGLKNPGHGTATMALLAGNHVTLKSPPFDDDLGGAPDAQVVPVRIADSVVHFWTDEMAEGIDYATNLPATKGARYCDVVSISMGGVASRAWAYAVNKAYDKGITLVAAAGNNYSNAPTRFTVYPSRFARVITVTGATSDNKPYRTTKLKEMQGNYGPPSVMRKAIAAFTPNIPWADWKSNDTLDLDGAGTSAATPQVAAAAVLWLQTHADEYGSGWSRVEAVRHALFESAEKKLPTKAESKEYFGNGLLRAANALRCRPSEKDLQQQPEDEVSFPLLRILLGWGEPNEGRQRMYEVEALNLVLESKTLSALAVDTTDVYFKMISRRKKDQLILKTVT